MVIRDTREPTPRPRRRAPWGLMVCLVVIGGIAAKITGVADPLVTRALQFLEDEGGRDMSTPSTRLVGNWVSDDDPMFARIWHPPAKVPCGVGRYIGKTGDTTRVVDFKIVSEDKAGTNMAMWEYIQGVACLERVEYSVDWDGLKMTRKYIAREGLPVYCTYHYTGEETSP